MARLSAWKLAVTAVLAVILSALPGHAACDPTTDPDKTDIANARAAVATNCNCTGAPTHGAYVSCAAQQANAVLTNKSCAGFVKKCASHSTCGRPVGAVTCCLTTTKGTTCKIKPDAAHCTAKQGTVGSCTSCCDACPAPGSGPSCPTTTTTTTLPSCTAPNACGGPCPTGTTCLYDFNRHQCFCDNCAANNGGCACLASNPPPTCYPGMTCSAGDTCLMNVCGVSPPWCFGPTCTSDTDCTGREVCTFLACCGAPGESCGPNFHCCSGTCSGGICSSPSGAFLD